MARGGEHEARPGPAHRGHLVAVGAPAVMPTPSSAVRASGIDSELAYLDEICQDLQTHTLAANTRRAYATAWRSFTGFCDAHELQALPAQTQTLRWYVAWLSTRVDGHGLPQFSLSTIRQYLVGVAAQHLGQGFLDPTSHRGVADLVRGLVARPATASVRGAPGRTRSRRRPRHQVCQLPRKRTGRNGANTNCYRASP